MRFQKWEVDSNTFVELTLGLLGSEKVYVNGVKVASKRNLIKFNSEIEFKLSQFREGKISIASRGFKPECKLFVDKQLILPENTGYSMTCPSCKTVNKINDKFCESCGVALPHPETIDRELKVKEARVTIQCLSVLFLFAGVAMFFFQKGNFDTMLANLMILDPSSVYEDKSNVNAMTVSEMIIQVQIQKYADLVLNIFIATLMLGLSFWAKKSPLSATIIAAAIYAAVIVLSALVDPTTLANGIFMKAIIISLLYKGIKAGLELKPAYAKKL